MASRVGGHAILIVADDLTGAADTAVQFANRGVGVVVALDAEPPAVACEVLATNTASRHLPPAQAAQRVRAAVMRARESERSTPLLYKKVDSMLRGNLGAELEGALAGSGLRAALLAPAYPAQGRVTVGGWQRFGPALDHRRSIPEVLRAQTALLVSEVGLESVRAGHLGAALEAAARDGGVVVADAETEGDLEAIAAAGCERAEEIVLAGTAGLAQALAARLPVREIPEPAPVTEAILVIVGSLSPRAREQAAALAARPGVFTLEWDVANRRHVAWCQARLGAALAAGRTCLVMTPPGQGDDERYAAALARQLREAVDPAALGALVLTGGDTALAMCRELGAMAIHLLREVLPGIPRGALIPRAAQPPLPIAHLPVVTKAGAFGDGEALVAIVNHLRRTASA